MESKKKDKVIAIVLAGGIGSRMVEQLRRENGDQSDHFQKKQYMSLLGKPMLSYALDAFEQSQVDEICLVVSAGDRDYVRRDLLDRYGYRKVTRMVEGGSERYYSVYNGLLAIEKDLEKIPAMDREYREEYVLIHDSARALITPELVNRCIRQVKKDKACVIGMPSKDTIRLADQEGWSKGTPPRKGMWIVHTPQCFVFREILDAFRKMIEAGDQTVTDDGMVMERFGNRNVRMFEGSYENIKITTPDDIVTGEAILRKRLCGKDGEDNN